MLLYSAPLSLFSRKVEIALVEKGVSFDRVLVPFTQTNGYAPKHPAVIAANPKRQVPVLVDDDLTLYDSTVIIEYLDDKYPNPPLLPPEPKARARCRLLELEADEVLLPPVRDLMFRSEPPGPDAARREEQERAAAKAENAILANYAPLAAKLGDQEYFCGTFSVADIAAFMNIHRGLRLGAPPLSGHENLSAWHSTLAKRTSFTTVIAEMAAADRELSYPVPVYRKAL
ncbi:MAG TPA: glutathione S-transferase family protein [Aestuariivirga sp.]